MRQKREEFNTNSFEMPSVSIDEDSFVYNRGIIKQSLNRKTLIDACSSLTNCWHKKIRDLSEDERQNFEIITENISLFYNTDAYAQVYDLINAQFSDLLKQGDIRAGTLSGYIGGCAIEKDFKQSCSLYCAGMPPLNPYDACRTFVMLALWNEAGEKDERKEGYYNFEVLQESESHAKAIVYCEKRGGDDEGIFSKEELDIFRGAGVEKLQVIVYSGEMKDRQYQIKYDFLALSELPVRGGRVEKKKKSSGSLLYLFLLFFLLILALFIMWIYFRKR